MSRTIPRVVITGIGAVTPIGNTAADYWQGMMEGRSGAGPISRFDATHFDTKFACELKNYDPTLHISRKEVQRMDLFTQYAMSCAVMAVEDSGLNIEAVNGERAGVIFGSGIGGMWTNHVQHSSKIFLSAVVCQIAYLRSLCRCLFLISLPVISLFVLD